MMPPNFSFRLTTNRDEPSVEVPVRILFFLKITIANCAITIRFEEAKKNRLFPK